MNRPHRLAVAVAGLLATGAACGVPIDEEARVLDHEGHEEVLAGASTTTSTTVPEDDPFVVTLYFVGQDDKLEVVERPYSEPPLINDVLANLEEGPTPDELDLFQETVGNLKTLIPPGLSAELNGRDEDRGVQFILVDPEAMLRQLLDDEPPIARVAVKQIVCTVLQLPTLEDLGIDGVEIYDGEELLPLTDDAAQPLAGPATLGAFSNCVTGTEEREAALLEAGDGEGEGGEGEGGGEADGTTTTTP